MIVRYLILRKVAFLVKSEKKISNEQALKLASNEKFINLEYLVMNRADELKEYFENDLRKKNAQLFARVSKRVRNKKMMRTIDSLLM